MNTSYKTKRNVCRPMGIAQMSNDHRNVCRQCMSPDEECMSPDEEMHIILNANNKTAEELLNLFAQAGRESSGQTKISCKWLQGRQGNCLRKLVYLSLVCGTHRMRDGIES
jgi:hypothetical protein